MGKYVAVMAIDRGERIEIGQELPDMPEKDLAALVAAGAAVEQEAKKPAKGKAADKDA